MCHCSLAVQMIGTVPLQTPPMQMSTVVQALPSLHGVLLGWRSVERRAGEECRSPGTSHHSSAEQMTGTVPLHTPPMQMSTVVQALPSLHGVLFGWCGLVQTPVCG